METLFGCKSTGSASKENVTRRSVLPPAEPENRVLDPKKSQNIAILLRALNVTRDEVCEALLDGKFICLFIILFLFLDIDCNQTLTAPQTHTRLRFESRLEKVCIQPCLEQDCLQRRKPVGNQKTKK